MRDFFFFKRNCTVIFRNIFARYTSKTNLTQGKTQNRDLFVFFFLFEWFRMEKVDSNFSGVPNISPCDIPHFARTGLL